MSGESAARSSGDGGGTYDTEQLVQARQQALKRYGIWTGYRRVGFKWQLLHDPKGTSSDLRYERRWT